MTVDGKTFLADADEKRTDRERYIEGVIRTLREAMAAQVTGAKEGAFIAPPPHAVAHHLLHWWLER